MSLSLPSLLAKREPRSAAGLKRIPVTQIRKLGPESLAGKVLTLRQTLSLSPEQIKGLGMTGFLVLQHRDKIPAGKLRLLVDSLHQNEKSVFLSRLVAKQRNLFLVTSNMT